MALRLDGSNDYVDLAVRSLPRAEAHKTIRVWFRNTATPRACATLCRSSTRRTAPAIHLGFDEAKVAAWRWGDFEPVVRLARFARRQLAPPGLLLGRDRAHRLYLDGAPIASAANKPIPAGPTRSARFGTWELPEEVFGGDIDEVRVYDRVLSADEITALAARP